ncbi:hypothetical protein ACIREE_38935 [Streptomyces sp. NPDC102467]|uniref:hypothetical protein n=1 Tax=Streptomyces sp. NPDC102467 TaxID=3366179 RepID=UPI00381B1C19
MRVRTAIVAAALSAAALISAAPAALAAPHTTAPTTAALAAPSDDNPWEGLDIMVWPSNDDFSMEG